MGKTFIITDISILALFFFYLRFEKNSKFGKNRNSKALNLAEFVVTFCLQTEVGKHDTMTNTILRELHSLKAYNTVLITQKQDRPSGKLDVL